MKRFYFSYTGTEPPESMMFGIVMNVEGFLGERRVAELGWDGIGACGVGRV